VKFSFSVAFMEFRCGLVIMAPLRGLGCDRFKTGKKAYVSLLIIFWRGIKVDSFWCEASEVGDEDVKGASFLSLDLLDSY